MRVDARAYGQCTEALRQVLATEPALDSRCGRQLQLGAITSFLLNLLDGSEVERQAGRSLVITSYSIHYTKLYESSPRCLAPFGNGATDRNDPS